VAEEGAPGRGAGSGTPGLRWEIGQMVKRLSPAKLLAILPDTDAQYRQFKAWADAVLPRARPRRVCSCSEMN
jgi:hypothetical protein